LRKGKKEDGVYKEKIFLPPFQKESWGGFSHKTETESLIYGDGSIIILVKIWRQVIFADL